MTRYVEMAATVVLALLLAAGMLAVLLVVAVAVYMALFGY